MKRLKNFNHRYFVLSTLVVTQLLSATAFTQGLTPAQVAQQKPAAGLTPAQVAQPTPAKKQLNLQELELKVARAAEAFAIDVIEVIGRGYQVRYNIREGLLAGERQIGDFSNSLVVQNSSYFLNALSSGADEGQARGLEAGARQAQLISDRMAKADIDVAVDAAIDSGKKIIFKPNPRDADFSGVESNLPAPVDFESRIAGSRSAVLTEARRMLDSRFPTELLNTIFDMRSIERGHDTTVPEAFRSDAAFENWKRNTLQSTASVYVDARNYYREITDANVYENTAQNEKSFRQALLYNYSRAIERAWTGKVQQTSSSALSFGRDLYLDQAESFAKELGRFTGYNAEHKRASVQSFKEQMKTGKFYLASYSSVQKQVETNSYIGSEQVRIQSEEGFAELTLGDTIDIFVDSLTNRGMKTGTVKVTPLATEQVTVMGSGGAIEVKGLTRLAANQRYQRQLWISDIKAEDQVVTVSVQVGDRNFQQSFKLSFEALIRKVASGRDAATADILIKKAAQYMKTQYDDISGFKDQYKDRKSNMLLVRMLNVFNKSSDAEKAELRKYGQIIRDVFGGKPSKFLNPKRNEWDSVQAMINEMGLTGSVPEKANGQPAQPMDPWNNGGQGG